MIYGDLVWTPHTGLETLPISVRVINIEMAGLCWYHYHSPGHGAGFVTNPPNWLTAVHITAGVIVGELLGESDRDNRGLETWDTWLWIGGTRVGVTVTEHVCCCSDIWQCNAYKILRPPSTTKWISDQDEIIKQRNKNRVWECQCRRSWQQPSELESHHHRSQIASIDPAVTV